MKFGSSPSIVSRELCQDKTLNTRLCQMHSTFVIVYKYVIVASLLFSNWRKMCLDIIIVSRMEQ